jgi:hypothetical protein
MGANIIFFNNATMTNKQWCNRMNDKDVECTMLRVPSRTLKAIM